MRKNLRLLLAALCLAALCLTPLYGCQGDDQAPPDFSAPPPPEGGYSLLDGRLLVDMPEGTGSVPVQQAMARAPESERVGTQLIYASGEVAIGLVAYELFQISSGSLEQDARNGMKEPIESGQQFDFQTVQVGSGLAVVEIMPRQFDESADMILIRAALVKDANGALIIVNLYANDTVFKNKDGCLAQAGAIIRSLRPGGRRLETGAHREQTDDFAIQLAEGYVLTKQYNDEFIVYTITKVIPAGREPPYMCVYLGASPSLVCDSQGVTLDEMEQTESTVLGESVTWGAYRPKPGEDKLMFKETMFAFGEELFVHVAIIPADEAEMTEMTRMAESMSEA